MKKWAHFYCRLCHQEMESPAEHDAGSWLHTQSRKERLDGHCVGDIRPIPPELIVSRGPIQLSRLLEFPEDGIEIK